MLDHDEQTCLCQSCIARHCQVEQEVKDADAAEAAAFKARRNDRLDILNLSDATCPCGADPREDDGAVDNPDWWIDAIATNGGLVAEIRCPDCH